MCDVNAAPVRLTVSYAADSSQMYESCRRPFVTGASPFRKSSAPVVDRKYGKMLRAVWRFAALLPSKGPTYSEWLHR
jgi:hypothetical protein